MVQLGIITDLVSIINHRISFRTLSSFILQSTIRKTRVLFQIAKYTSSYDSKIQFDDAKILNRAIQLNNFEGVKIRPILNCLEEELTNLYPFVKEAFQKNFLYTPISLESFKNKYPEAAKIMDSDYVLVAEDSLQPNYWLLVCLSGSV